MKVQQLLEADPYKGMKNVKGTVYLIHLDRPLAHSQHYIGWTTDLEKRIKEHETGQGSPYLKAAKEAGINFKVVRTWPDQDRYFERKLKNMKKARLLCPVCKENLQKPIVETQPSAVYKSTIPDVYKDLPKLGHGLTSLVLDKGDGTVLMFTRDKIKEEWLTRLGNQNRRYGKCLAWSTT